MKEYVQRLSGHWMTIATVTGAFTGILAGLILRSTVSSKWTDREISYIGFVGEIYLRTLKSLVLPLILSSLILSIGSLDLKTTGSIGKQTVIYFLSTTLLATTFGLIIALIVRPGAFADNSGKVISVIEDAHSVSPVDSLLDLIRNIFPSNWIEACLYQTHTVYTKVFAENETENFEWEISQERVESMNFLGIVCIASFCGIAISALSGEASTLLATIAQFNEIAVKITGWMIYVTPLGVFTLILAQILEIEDLSLMLGRLGIFVLTTCIALCTHSFIILPAIYFVMTRQNPYKIVMGCGQMIATAFGTASSSATLPVTMKCMIENIKIHKSVARFVLPLGAVVNMDGNAIYEALAGIFIAQIRNRAMTVGLILTVLITAATASIGTAGVPGSGLVTLVMVLDAIHLPPEDIAFVVPVDWLLDRFCTFTNILGDCFGAGIVYYLNREKLSTSEEIASAKDIEAEPKE